MSTSINGIRFAISNYRCFSSSKPANIKFQKGFTALIGPNNSGKSSILRFFFELRDIFKQLQDINVFATSLKDESGVTFSINPSSIFDFEELFCNQNDDDIFIDIEVDCVKDNQVEGILPSRISLHIPRGINRFHTRVWIDDKYWDSHSISSPVKQINNMHIKLEGFLMYLSPYLRTFEELARIFYIGPFRNAVNIGGNDSYFDIKIGQQFITEWDNHKSGNSKAAISASLRLTQDICSIFGYKTLEINASGNNQTIHVIVDNKPYRLEELGSGLTQYILVLANLAIEKPSWILIDEPELNLHPSLQIDFLTTIGSYASNGVVFSTHNMGLARASAEKIYSFHMKSNNSCHVSEFEKTPNLSEFLGELGFSGYRDLGFDKILLVEGSSEVKTIQQILRKYGKDHQVVILSLGGSDMIRATSQSELEEIKRISDNVYALIDSEKESSDAEIPVNRKAFINNCKAAKIGCHVTELRALENYLSDSAIKTVKRSEKYSALQPYEKLNECTIPWSKQENWRIAREMKKEEFDITDIGQFLRDL